MGRGLGGRDAAGRSTAHRVRTAALWTVWFCINLSYYGAFIWIPTLLVQRGFPLVRSFEFTLIITLAERADRFNGRFCVQGDPHAVWRCFLHVCTACPGQPGPWCIRGYPV